MGKKILVILLVILILLAASLGYALWNANALIEKHKGTLEKLASDLLRTPVSIEKFETSVVPATRLRIESLKLGAEPDVARLGGIRLDLSLLSLLARTLDITKLSLEEANITLIKTATGIHVAGFPKPAKDTEAKRSSSEPQAPKERSGGLEVNLKSLALSNVRLTVRDEVQNKEWVVSDIDYASEIQIKGADIRLVDQTLSASLPGQVPLAVSAPDVSFVSGKVEAKGLQITLPSSRIELAASFDTADGKGQAELGGLGLDLNAIRPLLAEFAPEIGALGLSGLVRPQIKADLGPGSFYTASGTVKAENTALDVKNYKIAGLNALAQIQSSKTGQYIDLQDLKLNLNNQPISAKFKVASEAGKIGVTELQSVLFAGKASGNFHLDGGADRKPFISNTSVGGVQIEQALGALAPNLPAKLVGKIDSIETKIGGEIGPQLTQSLKGTAQIRLRDAELRGTNLAGSVLKQIPLLSDSLQEGLPPDLQKALDSENTSIQSLTGDFVIGEASMKTSNLQLLSPLFALDAKGIAGFDGSLDLSASILFSAELMARLIAKNPQLKTITDPQGRLVVPLRIQRKGGEKLLVLPDVGKLMETAAKGQLRERAGEAIEKALNKKGVGKIFGF